MVGIAKRIKHWYRMQTSPSYKMIHAANEGIELARIELRDKQCSKKEKM